LKLILAFLPVLWSVPAFAITVTMGYQFPSTLTGAAVGVTGSITAGTNTLSVSDGSLYNVNDQVIISAVTGIFSITAISGNNLKLNANANATVKGAVIRTVVSHVDHSSFLVFWSVDTPTYNSIEFGTSPGKYPYRTYEVPFQQSTIVHIAIGGLNPGTTFYLRVQAKPNAGSDALGLTGLCNTDACGAAEITVTTSPAPAVHPQLPVLPSTYKPILPDTSGYKIIPVPRFPDGKITGSIEAGKAVLTVNTAAGLVAGDWVVIAGTACTIFPVMPGVSTQFPGCKIKSISGRSITLTSPVSVAVRNAPVTWALYTIQDLLKPANPNHTGYGTVFEWAQGYKGIWYTVQESNGPLGLRAEGLPPDDNPRCSTHPCSISDPAHRWIVFRTASGPMLLPPPGVRTGPAYAAALGAIVIQQSNPMLNGGEALYFTDGTFTTFAHHYLVQNMEFTALAKPSDSTDPRPTATPIFTSAASPAHTPQYLTLDRVYIHSPNKYNRMYSAGVQWEGKYMAIIGSYIGPVDLWRPYQPVTKPCSASGNVLTIPQETYQRNKLEKVWTMPAGVTATLTSAGGYTGNFLVYLKPDGTLGISYDAPRTGTASLSCGENCTATQYPGQVAIVPDQYAASQGGFTSNGWPYNTVKVCSGMIANNGFTLALPLFPDVIWATEGSVGIAINDGIGPYLFQNNHIEGYGIGFFVDSTGYLNPIPSDVTILRNDFYWNHDHISTHPATNGFVYQVRNILELKRGQRWLIKGNIFDGAFSRVNQGSSILFSGRQMQGPNGSTVGGEGIADMTVQSNVIRNGSETTYCQGGSLGLDPPLTKRILYYNNLEYKMNAFTYQDHPAAGYIGNTLRFLYGCQDVAVRHNTFYNHLGPAPRQAILGAQMWMEGLDISNNIFHLNSAYGDGIGTDGNVGIDYRTGRLTWPFIPAMDSTTYETALKTSSVRIGKTVIPDVTFAGNLIIGGTIGNTLAAQVNISAAAMANYRDKYGSFAARNTFAAGATRIQREAWAGWGQNPAPPPGSLLGFRLNSKSCCVAGTPGQATDGQDVGANIELLEQDRGAIYNVRALSISPAAATIAFTAPDPGAACYILYGTGPTSDVTSYKESAADTSNSRERSIALDGLASHTAYNAVAVCSGALDETPVAFSTP
jgi:hypothetical protein